MSNDLNPLHANILYLYDIIQMTPVRTKYAHYFFIYIVMIRLFGLCRVALTGRPGGDFDYDKGGFETKKKAMLAHKNDTDYKLDARLIKKPHSDSASR